MHPVGLELPILLPLPDWATLRSTGRLAYADRRMKDSLLILLHLAVTIAKLCGPGGVRAVIAENLVLKQQLIVLHRGRRRAPSLSLSDRLLCGFGSLFMDQFTRRLVGVGVHCGPINGADLCRMFNAAIHGQGRPRHLSTDHDPLFEAHRWTANLRILEIDEIKTVPHVPLSHPFVERLIGTMRREFLDQVLFWNARDLERTLADFQAYYNAARGHASLKGQTPLTFATNVRLPSGSMAWNLMACRFSALITISSRLLAR